GDGLCVQYAPEVFEFDIDGLAYVKDSAGELQLAPGTRVDVPDGLRLHVIDAAKECPGECIHVQRAADQVEGAGPDAAEERTSHLSQTGRPTSEATSRANSSSRLI